MPNSATPVPVTRFSRTRPNGSRYVCVEALRPEEGIRNRRDVSESVTSPVALARAEAARREDR